MVITITISTRAQTTVSQRSLVWCNVQGACPFRVTHSCLCPPLSSLTLVPSQVSDSHAEKGSSVTEGTCWTPLRPVPAEPGFTICPTKYCHFATSHFLQSNGKRPVNFPLLVGVMRKKEEKNNQIRRKFRPEQTTYSWDQENSTLTVRDLC